MVLFIITKIGKQPFLYPLVCCKCQAADKWIKKMWCIYIIYIYIYICIYTHTHTHTHTIEYYSAIKKNEILPFVAPWMDLENIMLSEMPGRER